jgi:hypothetical protein
MGPDRSKELFDAYVGASVTSIANELERTKKAEAVLQGLSEEFTEMPVTSPVAEPTMAAKMHALSKLGFDQMGIAGFNPMSMLYLGDNGISMQAVAAPAHDRYETSHQGNAVEIQTRAILIKPPTDTDRGGRSARDSSSKDDLEFFGLNLYAVTPETGEASEDDLKQLLSPAPTSASSDIVLSAAGQKAVEANQRLLVAKGEPLLGVTNIFAVRHKEHGTVKLYGISLSVNQLPGVATPGRDADLRLVVDLPNSMQATVTVLEGQQFDQALEEFSRATEAIKVAKELDPTATKFSIIERYALRTIMSGEALVPGVAATPTDHPTTP